MKLAMVRVLAVLGLLSSASVLSAQQVVVRVSGRGPAVARVNGALAAPHKVIAPGDSPALIARDSSYGETVIVLARDAIIEGRVHGDVIVIGGDAFVHPGANVDGSVVAVGGGAYGSTLAIVRGGLESHRDITFDVVPTGATFALDYRSLRVQPRSTFSLPGLYGVRIPLYDRSDGLSLSVGPVIALDTGRFEIEPVVTYRSHIGKIDPSLALQFRPTRTLTIRALGERSTYSNDTWIWSDVVNSLSTLALGNDTRNYYRADRASLVVSRAFESMSTEIVPRIGYRVERDRAIGPDSGATAGPYSFFGRTSKEHLLRPNPPAMRGTLRAALVGAGGEWVGGRVTGTADIGAEIAQFDAASRRFLQTTADIRIQFPTVRRQLFWTESHFVITTGDTAPPQRWAYLGGSGTLSTFDMLQFGGDQLLFLESNYLIPLEKIYVPILGEPSITFRHAIGSAGIQRIPALEQNISLRLALNLLRFEIVVDPKSRETRFGAGLSISR